jgi:hypothetical protein
MLTILFTLASAASAMTAQQLAITRAVISACQPPPWSVFINSALTDQLAFTEVASKKVYFDYAKFEHAPHTLANTLTHECFHLKGAVHGDGNIGMAYAVTERPDGSIVDDSSLLLFLPAQLFS